MTHAKLDQDLGKGNIGKELWSLAWPMMLSIFFYTLYNFVDAYWVSKLSANAIAAVSISQITMMLMLSLGIGITVGSGVLVSMNIGAKNKPEAERVLAQSFVLSAILGISFTTLALIFREQFLTAAGAAGEIFAPAMEYYTIVSAGSILMFMLFTFMFAFNSQGDTATLTKLFAISTAINLILDPLLILGHLGFPALGIAGAAYATLISQSVFIVIAFIALINPKRHIRLHLSKLSFRWESVKKVLAIGFPAALTQVIMPIGLAALTYMASLTFAEPGAVAFSLGFRLEFFAFLPAVGFGFGGMAMIGQSIGGGHLKRAQHILKKAIMYGAFGAAGLGILAALFAGQIIQAFQIDALAAEYSHSYLMIIALFGYGFLAIMMISATTFQAIGHSWPGFWIFVLRFGIITLPLSYLFTTVFGWPIESMWGAILAGNIIAAGVGYSWINRKLKHMELKKVPVHA